ncbi:MAG: hypothetical protein KKA73_30920 [Chloroflexi bacterium]|nr:hypothetical protein [Chloroflexota bacterium]MBU1752115.1 hypothetical protein [Chloroflexota bacterium]
MNRKHLIPLTIGLLCALLLAGHALAGRSSTNYRLDWFTPLTGGGGGPANSSNYAVNFTVGQSAMGASFSTNYGAGLGYWYGIGEYRIYLPLVLRDYG